MSPEQIRLVQTSWAQIQPQRAAAADLFYGRLFELAPDTRPLFKRDIHAQGAMLMQVLDHVVRGLPCLDDVLPQAEALARRHVGYGVQPQHYDSVGTALLWTLEQAHGAAFTPALRDAWTTAYTALAGAMKAAAYPAPARATPACWETPVLALSAAIAMAFASAPANAEVLNVSLMVRGVYDPTPMFSPGTHPEQPCGAACWWTFATAAAMSNAHDSTPGPMTAGVWPPPTYPIAPVVHPAADVMAVAPPTGGQVFDGGPAGVYQAATVHYFWQPAGPQVRQAGVQTWKTGSGASAVSYAIRLSTPPGAARGTYLEFGTPVFTRTVQNAYYVGGSGQQPISTTPDSLQSRAAVDVYVDGLPVWSSAANHLKPRRWNPPYNARQDVQWGPSLTGGGLTTLFLGYLPGGSTRTVSIVMRNDLYVDAPTCHSDAEFGVTYRRCHSQREVLSLPSVLSNTTAYGATAFTPQLRVYTR